MKVTEGLTYLKEIANHFDLRLHVAKEFKLAYLIFVVIHNNTPLTW